MCRQRRSRPRQYAPRARTDVFLLMPAEFRVMMFPPLQRRLQQYRPDGCAQNRRARAPARFPLRTRGTIRLAHHRAQYIPIAFAYAAIIQELIESFDRQASPPKTVARHEDGRARALAA